MTLSISAPAPVHHSHPQSNRQDGINSSYMGT